MPTSGARAAKDTSRGMSGVPADAALAAHCVSSVICATLPLLCAALTMPIVLALAVMVNRVWPLSVILVSVVSMVGLGLSIDYALLIISRYREALTTGLPRLSALSHAAETGGHTVIVSGSCGRHRLCGHAAGAG